MYQAIYDHNGVLAHAVKYTDTGLINRSREFIRRLYERGEPIADYFEREVKSLPPARPPNRLPDGYLTKTGRPGPIRS